MKPNKSLPSFAAGLLFVAAALLAVPLSAQVNYTGGTYTQDFNTLPTTISTSTLNGVGPLDLTQALPNGAGASGLTGWTLSKTGGSGANATMRADDGTSTSGSAYSYGTTASTDRALGTVASGTIISRFGVTFVNNTGQTITQFTLGYTGEQWRDGGNATSVAQTLPFSYAVGVADINTGTFTPVTTLNFVSPTFTTTAGALNGNASANRTVIAPVTVTGISWANGQTLVLRWDDTNDTGNDHGLAVDDLTFTTPVAAVATPGRLSNLSIRANAGADSSSLIVGFVTTGGTGNASLLARAGGPALNGLVTGFLADPALSVRSATAEVASNNNWSASLATTFTAVGATAWTTGSLDAATTVSVAPAPYTSVVSGGTGVALAEIYDVNTTYSASNPRLVNLSARAQVGTGENVLIAGFVVIGDTSVQVLVRGVGPKLSSYGVTGVLADPQLAVFSGSTSLASNDDWGASLATTFTTVGAFGLDSSSKDAALLVTLQPGIYTAQVSGVGSTTGVALVELYVVP